MTEASMIETVARVLATRIYGNDKLWQDCTDDARAAILAMREPTEAMEDAGIEAVKAMAAGLDPVYPEDARCYWYAMIDAALGEQP